MVKPAGITSATATNRIKAVLLKEAIKALPEAGRKRNSPRIKVGHGGTLDKGASGVLVIGVGEDCKRLSALLGSDKCYECVGKLGEATDTWDMDGRLVEEAQWEHVTAANLSETLRDRLSGEISQTPPLYSQAQGKKVIRSGKKRDHFFSSMARGHCILYQPRGIPPTLFQDISSLLIWNLHQKYSP